MAQLHISSHVSNKIHQKHRLSDDEVRDAVVCVAGLEFRWSPNRDGVQRAVVSSTIRDRPCAVFLYPYEHPMGDAWSLGSVYFVD